MEYMCRYCNQIIKGTYKKPDVTITNSGEVTRSAVCMKAKCLMLDIKQMYGNTKNI